MSELIGKLGKIRNKGQPSRGAQISLFQSSCDFRAMITPENYAPYFPALSRGKENTGKENLYHTLDLLENDLKASLSRSG